ncbi:hypothetical protein LSAT2_024274 [Lamellibrachia satsuma]|nr:hypothetical protein LSAT2_024274 [Lamellibrachia satsuma]
MGDAAASVLSGFLTIRIELQDTSVKVIVLVSAFLLLGCSLGAAKSAPQCRGEEYNPNFYICCGDYKYEKTTGAACCNVQPYNTYKQQCCHGQIMNKDEKCAD